MLDDHAIALVILACLVVAGVVGWLVGRSMRGPSVRGPSVEAAWCFGMGLLLLVAAWRGELLLTGLNLVGLAVACVAWFRSARRRGREGARHADPGGPQPAVDAPGPGPDSDSGGARDAG